MVTEPSLLGFFSHYAFDDMTVCWWGSTRQRFERPWYLLTQEEAVKKYYQNSSHRLTNLR
jgi:hypothetical protein